MGGYREAENYQVRLLKLYILIEHLLHVCTKTAFPTRFLYIMSPIAHLHALAMSSVSSNEASAQILTPITVAALATPREAPLMIAAVAVP